MPWVSLYYSKVIGLHFEVLSPKNLSLDLDPAARIPSGLWGVVLNSDRCIVAYRWLESRVGDRRFKTPGSLHDNEIE